MGTPKIMMQEKTLTILVAVDGGKYCAYCPELDLVTEMGSPDEAIDDIIEAIKEYADEYMADLQLYSNSPNRSHHLPYIEAVKSCKTAWDLRMLIEIRHGLVHV